MEMSFEETRQPRANCLIPMDEPLLTEPLPFGTCLVVGNPRNGKAVNVRVNDRGPFVKGRVLDLAAGAARAIGMYATQSVTMRPC